MAHVHKLRWLGKTLRTGALRKDGVTRVVKSEEVNEEIGNMFAADLKGVLYNLQYKLKYYKQGRQTGDIVGTITVRPTNTSVRVDWRGRRIAYIEYGAGAPAVGQYKGKVQTSYKPQAEGHSGGEYWAYRGEVMNGWRPYAPYYNTYLYWTQKMPRSRKQELTDLITYALSKETAKMVKAKKSINIYL